MSAVLTYDPSTQRLINIRFNGGIMHEPPLSFTNTADIHFNGLGTKRTVFAQSSSGLDVTVNTIGSAHSIDSNGRILETERMQSYPISGTLTAKITIDGRTQTQTIDVATNPPDRIEPSTGTVMRLQLSELQNHGSESDYKLTINTTFNGSRSERLPNTDTTVTNTTTGSTVAEAYFVGPNKFGQWLLDNGYDLNDELSTDQRGIQLAVLYAFNMSPNENQGLPWSFVSEHGSLVLTLRLPDGGMKKAVQIETCDDLRTGDWYALSPVDFLGGNSNLNQGASGIRRIKYPDTGNRFYRIASTDSGN